MNKWSKKIYSGLLENYHYPDNKEVGEFLNFLQRINSRLKIHLTDASNWDMPFPDDTSCDVYIVCSFGEFVNEDMLHKFDANLADRKLVLLTSQYYDPNNLKNFTVFTIEHLHTIVRFFNPCLYEPLLQRPYVHATQSRRNALHKSLLTQHLLTRYSDLQYTFCNKSTVDYQIETFQKDLQVMLAMTCSDQIVSNIKNLHDYPRELPGDDWDITNLYKTSKLFWATESIFLSRLDCPTAYLTEKTFKPIIAGCVWIIAGQKHSYQRIRDLGFETFESDFGITYDNYEDRARMEHIYSIIDNDNFEKILNSPTTQHKVDYNYNHFFNHFVTHVEKANQSRIEKFIDYVNGL